jgi:glycerol kinase
MILAVDQGTTNTKAVLVAATGDVRATGSAAVGVSTPRPGWVEQDADRLWASVVEAVEDCLAAVTGAVEIAGLALSTQRESVVAWSARTGRPVGPVIGWQDRRTADWCAETIGSVARETVRQRTGLRVDPMFSAPKLRWLLDHLPADVGVDDVRVGTVDAWLLWRLSGGEVHRAEAGNASRTLLFDVTELAWSDELCAIFGIPPTVLPEVLPSAADFGSCAGVPGIPDGTPIVTVLADSHAALYGHDCTEAGMAKATYGTGSSVMTPVAGLPGRDSPVPTTLAWLVDGRPTYALEGNILYSGAALAWAADLLVGGDVRALIEAAASVEDSAGVTLVPAFAGLGAPHWDRGVEAIVSGLSSGAGRAQVARAAVDAVAHQICDIVDVIEATAGPLSTFRADGGASASALVMQTQADLLAHRVDVGDVAEVSALGAARLGWSHLGRGDAWPAPRIARSYEPGIDDEQRRSRRRHWSGEIARARFVPGGEIR